MGTLNPHITPEVVIWTITALVGCIVSFLSLREIGRNRDAIYVANPTTPSQTLLRVVNKDQRNEVLRGLAQILALLAGFLSLFFTTPQPAPTPPPSVAGFLILILLIGLELVLVYNSLQDYLSNRASVQESINETTVTAPVT